MLPSVCPGVYTTRRSSSLSESLSTTSGLTGVNRMKGPIAPKTTPIAPLTSFSFFSPESRGASASCMATFAPVRPFSLAALPEWSMSGWVRTM